MRMVSEGVKLQQCHGLLGTKDLNDWEARFVESLWYQSKQGKDTTQLTEKQIDRLEVLWSKHFS